MKTAKARLFASTQKHQSGVATVEFALIAMILFALLLGIMEFGRLLFTWNSAVEATRRGARLAIVCDMNATGVKNAMRQILPIVATGDITVNYSPSTCTGSADCQSVTVSISPNAPAFHYNFLYIGTSWRIPAFSTTLTRESLSNGTGADQNPDCSIT
ncbi:TadE family protein [Pseudogulbenkiania sp. NH8B]|uniref:TadE/TadG family type IV pilus assembly protein n=1 Tax=Pseudogulbenkiania sp. (strain NH8B) TaxID=748280 RepID=UPI0002279F0D|nr:TadE/TadG family type IV pilus assembly protein [Pseudogulbenkiania sp. NH8B]BAK77188.1 TadE family protein [Pseudogulbenkiania sp. NH8B]